jgi:heme/copper-type cytochrome/quinol oxidase subunit 1
MFAFYDTWQLVKARILYVTNNWIYTTNHKRISVNYYFFVILSGTVGMVLATIIRLEMAYPGVGILAGDSLQYLTVVTAHAVIMVFFMIMPLLFGAFANFLLPTQLGVHDVAFPRLNSAAFWFLPAGFLMLCQLACIDRRYQRMNCFNIREVQTLLRSRYQPESWDSNEHRHFLRETTVGLRFQTLGFGSISPNMLMSFQYGLNIIPSERDQFYYRELAPQQESTLNTKVIGLFEALYTNLITFFGVNMNGSGVASFSSLGALSTHSTISEASATSNWNGTEFVTFWLFNQSSWEVLSSLPSQARQLPTYLESVTNLVTVNGSKSSSWLSLTADLTAAWLIVQNATNHFNVLLSTPLSSGLNSSTELFEAVVTRPLNSLTLLVQPEGSLVRMISQVTGLTTSSSLSETGGTAEIHNHSKSWVSTSISNNITLSGEELNSNTRRQRSASPVVGYNFKVGDFYPSTTLKFYPSIFRSLSDVTRGVRRASWQFSPTFQTLWSENFGTYMAGVAHVKGFPVTEARSRPNTISFNSGFYNFFYLFSNTNGYINSRWLSLNSLDQKFYRMFMSSTMQQRIYTNWRHLKFTREAWRCRLLASRHQKTLYRRFGKEESLVWSVEKNAKDVLPGWAMITPFSARVRYTAIGKVDLGLMGVFLVLNSSIVSSANFLVTYRYLSTLNNRKMRDARSFFTEGVMVASWMMIAANPMLAIGILMLLADRHWQTCFFDYSGGGDTVLFQHMFWFFGHPEVYVIMIPAFGFNNTILSFYLRKRVSARASLMYSMYTIAFLGFFVWGHHMYMVGLAHTTRMLFSTLTVMISVPAATKLMHWCVTLVNSSLWVELPFIFALLFIFFFVSGGISGMAVAHTGMDILFHDSFYVVGHFHVMFAGSAMFASFGAFYFYFPSIFGLKFSRVWGYLHVTYFLLGQLMTVVPMFWLGYSGMPRRVLDYPASLGGWHAIVSAGHLLSVAGLTAFYIMIFDSMRQGRPAIRNSFGVSRFNTRFSFYLYESARLLHIQQKGWSLARHCRSVDMSRKLVKYGNHENLETTLYSYVLVQKQASTDTWTGNDQMFPKLIK